MVCVGLDPDSARLPNGMAPAPAGIGEFCRQIVDATAEYACAFKPQAAYFGALGLEDELAALMVTAAKARGEDSLRLSRSPSS